MQGQEAAGHREGENPSIEGPIAPISTAPWYPEQLYSRLDPIQFVLARYVIVMFVLIALYSIAMFVGSDQTTLLANQSLPALVMLISLWASYELLQRRSSLLWTPMPWFFAAVSVYYGLGPISYYFGREATVEVSAIYYLAGENEILKSNLVNCVGITCVVLAFMIGNMLLKFPPEKRDVSLDINGARKAAYVFLAIGLPVKYLLALPSTFGYFNFVAAGGLLEFQHFTSLAIIVLVAVVARGHKGYRPLLYTLVFSEVVAGLISFSKLHVIVVVIMVILGHCLHRFSFRKLVIGGLCVIAVYVITTPIVPYGRGELYRETGRIDAGGFGQRLKIVESYLVGERIGEADDGTQAQMWWARLNYTPASAFAITSYDNGEFGDSLTLIWVSLIPRIIWPEKTIISDIGSRFNVMATGNPNSHSAPGVFAEAYWDGGWALVFLMSLFLGFLFFAVSRIGVSKMEALNFGFLPCVFIGIRMGLRPDGWFIIEYWGTLVSFICLYAGIALLSVLNRRKSSA